MIQVGDKLPTFELENQQGQTKTLNDFLGRWLVLYVYPEDGTPGCTIEGKSFSADKDEFEQAGARVVGLSQDDVKSHRKFSQQYGLFIDLLADPENRLLQALGVKRTKDRGLLVWNRTTFLVDPKGVVRKIYENVDPEGHDKIVLEDLRELQAEGPSASGVRSKPRLHETNP
jgi:peroxiredoxin Q/BCP